VPETKDKEGERLIIHGLMGIVNICGFLFLAVISEKTFAGKLLDG
jgi:hypothetical protein